MGTLALILTAVLGAVTLFFGGKWLWLKTKFGAVQGLFAVLSDALEDDKLDEGEITAIIKAWREIGW